MPTLSPYVISFSYVAIGTPSVNISAKAVGDPVTHTANSSDDDAITTILRQVIDKILVQSNSPPGTQLVPLALDHYSKHLAADTAYTLQQQLKQQKPGNQAVAQIDPICYSTKDRSFRITAYDANGVPFHNSDDTYDPRLLTEVLAKIYWHFLTPDANGIMLTVINSYIKLTGG